MIILIDAYNVIKQALQKGRISLQEKKSFINLLGRYAKRKKHKIIIFFDGGDSMYPFEKVEHGLTIVFSGYKQCADSLIVESLGKYKNYDTLLVSSDRELRDYAKKLNTESVGALYFYNKISSELLEEFQPEASGEVQKLHPQEEQKEIDLLMMQASEHVLDKDYDFAKDDKHEPERHKARKSKSFTKSKKDQKKGRKIEKL